MDLTDLFLDILDQFVERETPMGPGEALDGLTREGGR